MARHSDIVLEIVSRINAREEIDIARFFTPDFVLDQPGGVRRTGHEGARAMIDAMLALGPDVQVGVLDIMEDGDRVAVRYDVMSASATPPLSAAMIAIYQFVDGRIAADWGLAAPEPWQR